MSWTRVPRIRSLTALQAGFVLSRNRVGRLAFMGDGRLELLPVHYVFADGVIVGRTSFGARAASRQAGTPDVVFEVDEPEALFEWRSVVVRGAMQLLTARSPGVQRQAYWDAVTAFRSLVPDAFTERDPTPSRRVVFRITPKEITGREASSSYLSRTNLIDRGSADGDHL